MRSLTIPPLPDDLSALWSHEDERISSRARLAKKANDRAVVAKRLMERGVDDLFTAAVLSELFESSVAEQIHWVREISALVPTKEVTQ